MIEGMPWQAWTSVMGASVSLNAFFVWMVMTGRVATGREVKEKNATIADQKQTIAHLSEQNSLMLGSAIPATNAVMNALHQAVENGGA